MLYLQRVCLTVPDYPSKRVYAIPFFTVEGVDVSPYWSRGVYWPFELPPFAKQYDRRCFTLFCLSQRFF